MHNLARLLGIMSRLRDPQNGCPWDLEQDFASIAPHMIEEAYEVADAIEKGDMAAFKDELGDLLLQVVFHAQIAKEKGLFDFYDVANGIGDKLIRRHPHLYGNAKVATADEQIGVWEEIKAQERAGKTEDQSALAGLPIALPALMRACKLQKRAARVGFDWPHVAPVYAKVEEELAEVKSATTLQQEEEIGDLLFACVNLSRHMKVNPETALRAANAKFERRFRAVEKKLNGKPDAGLDEMGQIWDEIKQMGKVMTYDLNDKTIFVTGATSGFGLAIAQQAAKAGARLVLCGRREDRLATLISELKGCEVFAAPLDVRDNSAVENFLGNLPQKFSCIDILINNAGLALGLGPAYEADLTQWEQMIDTNIKGLTYCTRAVLPGMVAQGSGHIVNMGSIAGEYPYPGGNVYGGTKGFVKQFSLNLRADLLGKNIRVTLIEPGMAETEFSLVRFGGDGAKAANVYKGIQALTADDVADSILWAVTRPPHVNVNRLELMPTCQAFAPFAVHRES